jgi:hypothetical protein
MVVAQQLLLLAVLGTAARVPGSPFPVPALGLNASRTLFAYDIHSGSETDAFTVQTLQGVLAQQAPRLFRFDSSNGAAPYSLWLNETSSLFGVTIDYSHATNAAALIKAAVASFPADVAGYALTSLDDNSTNACVAAAAAARVLCVTEANEQDAVAAGLARLLDVRGKGLAWVLESYGGNFSRSVTVLQLASEGVGCMSDYSIASKALQWWQDDVVFSPLSWIVWGELEPPFAMLGWGPDEYDTVNEVSKAGGVVVASNWASNVDALSAFDVPSFTQGAVAPPPLPPAPRAVHTVTFLMSDGDNLQWVLDGFCTDPRWFGSLDRGSVSLGWTLGPTVADLAPAVLSYLYNGTAQPAPFRDVFVAGVSGAGYFYPDSTLSGTSGPQRLAATVQLTADYMAKAGMRVANVMAHGEGFASDALPAEFLKHDQIDALLFYNYDNYAGLRGSITFVSGKPVIGGRYNLWGSGAPPDPVTPNFYNVSGLIDALVRLSSTDATSADGYSLIPLHAWSHTVSDARAVMVGVQALAPGRFEFVAPDELVARVAAFVKH